MITCSLTYQIDPYKVAEFEIYARAWIHIITRMGGTHHGYWFPHEGANDTAYCHFSFPSLADYEDYRNRMAVDEECNAAYAYAERTRCIIRYDRSFTRPVLDGQPLGDHA
ncbi:NIPSNAP family protein [Pacificibacter marinus]|uniref:NIPSNAP family protein n=1 Tax=Pacificibacter marinus TaxID=658057 RepID=UPI001C079E61|nr:NIPSNAP family protein [Pacificibacter marinus]MBU2865921.1 NIPSNAP family protein [Pacificibacter marinus]